MNKKSYLKQVLIALDQLANALLAGWSDETLSSRCYRGAILATNPKKRWKVAYHAVNALFFDKNHCRAAYRSELDNKQLPPEFRD